jgi:hypothetical protein
MKTCNADAKTKALKGDERKAFMKSRSQRVKPTAYRRYGVSAPYHLQSAAGVGFLCQRTGGGKIKTSTQESGQFSNWSAAEGAISMIAQAHVLMETSRIGESILCKAITTEGSKTDK